MRRVLANFGLVVALLFIGAGCGGSAAPPATVAVTAGTRTFARSTLSPSPMSMPAPITAPSTPSAIPTASPPALQPAGKGLASLITALNALQRFPAGYQQTLVRYATVDRPNDGGGTVRDTYIDPVSLAAFRKDGTLPTGTVIVMDQFAAKRGADGGLLTNPQGRLIPAQAQLVSMRVKLAPGQTVSGDQLPKSLRNGTWVYVTFDPLNHQRDSLDNTVCSACHQQAASSDYLFTRSELVAAVKANTAQYTHCDLPGRQPCQVPGQ